MLQVMTRGILTTLSPEVAKFMAQGSVVGPVAGERGSS